MNCIVPIDKLELHQGPEVNCMPSFEYDIAFSFTTDDEGIATQLNDRLQDRYRTFLYSKAQDKLVGTDGADTFGAVFNKQARSVVVLLRPEWGTTPFTRVEQTAIKNRAHDHGYDFATFIVTVPGTPIPDWLPKTRLWYDLPRFGLDGAVAVLAARIQERGGAAVEETLAAKMARLERAQNFSREKEAFVGSKQGVDGARAAHRRVVDDINHQSDTLQKRRLPGPVRAVRRPDDGVRQWCGADRTL